MPTKNKTEKWEISKEQLEEITAFIKQHSCSGCQVRVRCDNRTETPMIWHWTARSTKEIRQADEKKLAELEAAAAAIRNKLYQ